MKRGRHDEPEVNFSEMDGVRHLHLGTEWVQGSMRVKAPFDIELEYVQRMMAWMLLRPAAQVHQGHAVQLGLGAGAITKFCHKRLRMRTTAVELNPQVVAMARRWFSVPPDDARLTVRVGDAADYVRDPSHAGSVHALCVDLYDHEAACPVLDDVEFYRHCRQLLASGQGGHAGGVMSVNLFGRQASFTDSLTAIIQAFEGEPVWTLTPTREGNTVVLATQGLAIPDRDELRIRAQNVETRYGLPALKWVRMLKRVPP